MRKLLSIPRHGVLVSFKQSTVTAQPKEGPLDDTPSRPKPLADIPGPKGIYNLPVLGNAFHFAPYRKFIIIFLPGDILELELKTQVIKKMHNLPVLGNSFSFPPYREFIFCLEFSLY